jgi:UDP-N-acetylmuramoyl-tripeptide--D-alanyl-D-alanine ligase
MKSYKKQILEKALRRMAKMVLRRHRPQVVALTGSVGKTTTKEMVAQVLEVNFRVRKNNKNYNNEVGVPLTIIGAPSGGSSWWRWLKVGAIWMKTMLSSDYPEILVLEMGADWPGDIEYLCSFVPIKVGILTNVGISHLEYFKSKKDLLREKAKLLRSIDVAGLAIGNHDNSDILEVLASLNTNQVSFGFEKGSTMQASDVAFNYEEEEAGATGASKKSAGVVLPRGVSFKVTYQGKIIPVKLSHSLGKPQVYAAMAALLAGEYFKINLLEGVQALEDFYPPAGRMVLLEGIKHTALIDDTYNSAPDSSQAALEVLGEIKAQRKIAVLGDMLELGSEEEAAHREAGQQAAKMKLDCFIGVGDRMKKGVEEFRKGVKAVSGKESQCKGVWFESPEEAKFYLQEIMEPGDLVLIKGSQGMRMEKVVEEVMNNPEKKEELLTRQDEYWINRKFEKP